jgi:hypothetical protein
MQAKSLPAERPPASIYDVLTDALDEVREAADTLASMLGDYKGVPSGRMLRAVWALQKARRYVTEAWDKLDGK